MLRSGIVLVLVLLQQTLNTCINAAEDFDITTVYRFQTSGNKAGGVSGILNNPPNLYSNCWNYESCMLSDVKAWMEINSAHTLIATAGDEYQDFESVNSNKLKPLSASWLDKGFVLSVNSSNNNNQFSLIFSTGDNAAISDMLNISIPLYSISKIPKSYKCKNYDKGDVMRNEARRCVELDIAKRIMLKDIKTPECNYIFIRREGDVLTLSGLNATGSILIQDDDLVKQIGYVGVYRIKPVTKFHLWKPVNMLALVQSYGAIEFFHDYTSEAFCIAVEHYLQPGSGAKLLLKAVLGNGTELTIGTAEAQQNEEKSAWKTQVFLWDRVFRGGVTFKLIAEKENSSNVFIKNIRSCTGTDDSNLSTANRQSSVELVIKHNAVGLPIVSQDGHMLESGADFESCSGSSLDCSWEILNMDDVIDTESPLHFSQNRIKRIQLNQDTLLLPFKRELKVSFTPQSSHVRFPIYLLKDKDVVDPDHFYRISMMGYSYGYSYIEKCTSGLSSKQHQCTAMVQKRMPGDWLLNTGYNFTLKFSEGLIRVLYNSYSYTNYELFNWRDSSPLKIKYFKITPDGTIGGAGTVIFEKVDRMWHSSSGNGSMTSKQFTPRKNKVCVSVMYKGQSSSIQLELHAADGVSLRLPEKQTSYLRRDWKTGIYILDLEGRSVKPPMSVYLKSADKTDTWIKRVAGCDAEEEALVLSSSSELLNMDFIWYDVAVNSSFSQPHGILECMNGGMFHQDRNICICPAGFTGSTCEYGCGMDRFGLKCDSRCSMSKKGCKEMRLCRPIIGCSCAPGYKGLLCDTPCGSGKYGANCSQSCGHCDSGTCDIFTGQCSEGCSDGYYPPLCQHNYKYLKTAPEVTSFDSHSMNIKFDVTTDNLLGRGMPTFYQLQTKVNEDAQWKELTPALLPTADTVDTNITGVDLRYNYQIRVVLLDADGSSYQGEKVPITTISTECAVPTEIEYDLQAESVTENEFQIKWKYELEDPTWCLAEHFEVEKKVDTIWRSYYKGKETSCEFSNLLPGEMYQVRVKAVTSGGPSSFSQPLSVTTKEGAPGAVSSLRVSSVSHDQLEITWERPALGTDVQKYKVAFYCRKLLACPGQPCEYSSGEIEVATTTIRLRGLLSLAQYDISVQASGVEYGPQSHIFAATYLTVPNVAPNPNKTPVTDRTNSSFTVHWEPPENCTLLNGFLEGYRYELKGPNSAAYEGSTTKTSATFTGLAPRTEYTVNVYVVATGGSNEKNALEILASTRATVPGRVERLTAYKTGRRIIGVRWALPNETYGQLRSFTITHKAEGQPAFGTVVKPSRCVAWPDLYCYTLSALLPDTKYKVTVQARNMEIEEDGEVAEVTALTKEYAPEAPSYIRIVSETETNLTVEWGLPNTLNGVLRSFLVSVEQTDSYNSSDCCQYFPIQEVSVNREQANYQIQLVGVNEITVQDNHKPVFKNCSQYAPTVKEEEPSGTYVFTVKAHDKDPPEAGGTITYTFVSARGERMKFAIDPETGVITTRHMFDRDEPAREKEVYLTIRATDNGHPQLDDACTFKVTIEDVNDNSPVFDKVNYRESVPQDLPVGGEVMRISAPDIDDGNNSIVLYKVEPKQPQDEGYLRIDSNTGVIFLNRTIDKRVGHTFRLRATATDQGLEHNINEIDLDILVVDSRRKAPSFKSGGGVTIQLKENYHDFSTPVATLTAESNIPGESDLQFELISGRTEQTNSQKTFILETQGPKAMIKLGRQLDYESISEYTLMIRVQNKFNLAATTTISIQVLDVNDNIPAFTEVLSGSVLENEPPGIPVMQVRAIDANNQLQELRPAATYTISVTAKTMALGPAVSVTAHTRPPVPSMDGMIDSISEADLTITSKPSFTIHPYTEREELVSSYLLLVIPQAAETEVPETLIWNEDIEKLLSRKVNGTFYVAAELSKEDISEQKGQVTLGVPDGIKRGKWSGFFNPELKHGEQYRIGLALILQYCGVFNVGFVQTDVLTVN